MPVDVSAASALIDQALRALDQAKAALVSPVLPSSILSTPSALDTALSHASSGDTLVLAPELVYAAPLVLHTPVMLLSSVVPLDARMTVDVPCPRFLSGIQVPSDGVGLIGLDVSFG